MSSHPNRSIRAVPLSAALLATASLLTGVSAATLPQHVLYIESNNSVAGENAVLAYHRNSDGSLTPLPGSPFATGGTGWFDPTYAIGPLDGEGIMATDPVGGVLFVPNGGSDTIAALHMAADGSLHPIDGSPFAITGNTPETLALRGRMLVIGNNARDPNQAGSGVGPSYVTAHLDARDHVVEVPSATVNLPPGTEPDQELPVPGTPLVFTDEFMPAPGTVSSWFLDLHSGLHLIERQSLPFEAEVETSPPLPLGQAVNPLAPYLYIGSPNVSRVMVYRLRDTGEADFVRSVGDSGKGVCWLHISADGKLMYASNTADVSISVFDLSRPDKPVEIQHLPLRGATGGLFDFGLSPDGQFLYAVEEEFQPSQAGLSNQVHMLGINQTTGVVTEVASSPLKLPVAGGTRPQGVVVY